MPEMTVATRAQHFATDHAMARIGFFLDVAVRDRLREAWPPTARIEFGIRFEQVLPAARAYISARCGGLVVFTTEWALGRLLAKNGVLHRSEFLAPFRIVLCDLLNHVRVPCS